MSDILDRIDAATAGQCPCGGQPREGSAYCGEECEPTHIGEDTDAPGSGTPTPMRWRPDLVTAADDNDLMSLGSETHGYTGWFNAQVYERASDPTVWHLRLDDGHRYVGVDLTDVGGRQDPITDELVGRVRQTWQRLERELTNPAYAWAGWQDLGYVDATDPWADVIVHHDPARELLEVARARRRYFGAALPAWLGAPDEQPSQVRRSYHNQVVRAVAVSAADLEGFGRVARQSLRPLVVATEAFLRDVGGHLTEWQRHMLEQMTRVTVVAPLRTGRSPAQWLPDEVWAALNQSGRTPQRERPAPEAEPDEMPADPMQRALWLRQRRNTGPVQDRLDGRRRRGR